MFKIKNKNYLIFSIFISVILFLSILPQVFSSADLINQNSSYTSTIQNDESSTIRTITQQQTSNDITLYGSATQGWGLSDQSMTSPGPQITFQEGELINMTLISTDGLVHQFFVDYNNNGTPDEGEPSSPSFTSTINYQFTPDRTGEFPYYCNYHPTIMYGNTSIIPEFSILTLIFTIAFFAIILIFYRKKIFS